MKFTNALILSALMTSSAGAAKPADLIRQLGDDDWSSRQAAEDALVAKGLTVINDLSAALSTTGDAELRTRLGSAIARINREQLTSATPVTLDKTFDRPVDALRAVANVAGLSVAVESDAAKPLLETQRQVHVSCRDTPLIQALLDVAADGGVAVRLIGEKVVVMPKPAAEGRPLAAVSGALALVADSSRRSESFDFSSGRRNNGTYVTLLIYTEPKLRLDPGSVQLTVKTLTDEQGRPLQLRQMKLGFAHTSDGRWNCTLSVPPLDPPPARIARLDVELFANAVVQTDDLHVDDLSTLPVELRVAAGTIGIQSVAQVGGNWTLVLRMPPQAPIRTLNTGMPQAFQMTDPDVLTITDGHGRRLLTGMPQLNPGPDANSTIPIMLASPDDPPKSVLIRVPSQRRELRMLLSLHDLPLP